MDNNQLVIKIALIIAAAVFALFLLLPGRGVRHIALRRLSMLALFAIALLAIIFPQLINGIANLMGVGRGADLLLYGLIIVFVGNSIVAQRRHRLLESEITKLARSIALAQTPAVSPPERTANDG
jgi:small membrane protein